MAWTACKMLAKLREQSYRALAALLFTSHAPPQAQSACHTLSLQACTLLVKRQYPVTDAYMQRLILCQ